MLEDTILWASVMSENIFERGRNLQLNHAKELIEKDSKEQLCKSPHPTTVVPTKECMYVKFKYFIEKSRTEQKTTCNSVCMSAYVQHAVR
jgi:hypothetical protein